MAVGGVLAVPVLLPFLYLTVFAYLIGSQLGLKLIELSCEIFVNAELACGFGRVFQYVVDHLVVHSYAAEHRHIHFRTVIFIIGIESGVVFGRV